MMQDEPILAGQKRMGRAAEPESPLLSLLERGGARGDEEGHPLLAITRIIGEVAYSATCAVEGQREALVLQFAALVCAASALEGAVADHTSRYRPGEDSSDGFWRSLICRNAPGSWSVRSAPSGRNSQVANGETILFSRPLLPASYFTVRECR